MKLDGKAAVLTGAGGLLGRALAERFIAEGATGLVLCDDDPGPSETTAASLQSSAMDVVVAPADVRDPAAVDRLVDVAMARHDHLDVMINNAGIIAPNGAFTVISAAKPASEKVASCSPPRTVR
ncbi:MAG: hypothetical protein QOI86_3574 [Actinomycetota bacterium]|nr:hypothetical protein [Actinomycetota bacterium]